MALGTVKFRSAASSGVLIHQVGSGTFDHIAFYGVTGETSQVAVGTFQGSSFIAQSDGTVAGTTGTSGELTNCARVVDTDDTSGVLVKVVGNATPQAEVDIVFLSIFDPASVATYPDFVNRASGTLFVEFIAPSSLSVHTFNAKYYAFDNGGAITDPPPDVRIYGFEINPSGQFVSDASISGVWKLMDGQSQALDLANHSNALGWHPREFHYWTIGISALPEAIGALDQFDMAFQVQFI